MSAFQDNEDRANRVARALQAYLVSRGAPQASSYLVADFQDAWNHSSGSAGTSIGQLAVNGTYDRPTRLALAMQLGMGTDGGGLPREVGVGGCAGGCSSFPQILVPKRCVLEPGSLTPAQAGKIMHDAGTYGDWIDDVPVQGPTDRDIRKADCWWKDNVLDKATDNQGRIVPQWTQNSLCIGNRLTNSGIGAPPPAAAPSTQMTAPALPGIWSKISDAESHWVATALVQLNALIVKAGNPPCASWPADLLKDNPSASAKMPAAVACFQSWSNANAQSSLRTDGTLDHATLCALVAVTRQHAGDFPAPYPGSIVLCLPALLSTPAKIGIGVAAVAVIGGTVAAIAMHKKKAPASHPGR